MNIVTNGILVNQNGEVLLIQRNDTRTFAPPGGSLDAGELPTDGAAREVREETGLIVMPVRLVNLAFWPIKPHGHLVFVFRCLMRGGQIKPSPESPHVGFYSPRQLPRPMLRVSRKRIQSALAHTGGPVRWHTERRPPGNRVGRFILRHVIYRLMDWRRKLRGQPPYVPPRPWKTAVYTIISNENGEILWTRPDHQSPWQLPGGPIAPMTSPWETAVQMTASQTELQPTLSNLGGVYVTKETNEMTFVFTAQIQGGLAGVSSATLNFVPSDVQPENTLAHHAIYVVDDGRFSADTIFHYHKPT